MLPNTLASKIQQDEPGAASPLMLASTLRHKSETGASQKVKSCSTMAVLGRGAREIKESGERVATQ
jgi:hypothetical protein